MLLNTTAPGATVPSSFTQQTFYVGVQPSSIAVEVVNGDGRLDVILANPFNDSVPVLLNTQYETTITGNTATGTILRDIIFTNSFH